MTSELNENVDSDLQQSSGAEEANNEANDAQEGVKYGLDLPDEGEKKAPESSDDDYDEDGPRGIKARLGRERKKYESEINALRSELEKAKHYQASTHPQDYQYQNQYNQGYEQQPQGDLQYNQDGMIYDSLSGQYVDPNSEIGRYALYMNQVQQNQSRLAQEQQAKAEQERKSRDLQELNNSFEKSVESALERYDDYENVITGANFSDSILDASRIVPNAGDLLYRLGKNPKELERISRLSPYMQAQELMKHSMAMAANSNLSKAPPPAKPVDEAPGQSSLSVSAENFQQWKAARKARQRGR